MRHKGFTLVELVVVMAIIGILLSMATLQFDRMTRKARIEGQVKTLVADLMTVRSEALLRKRARAVSISPSSFAVYSSAVAEGSAVSLKKLVDPMVSAPTTILFDTRGMAISVEGGAQALCVEPADNPGSVDSVVVSLTRIQIGKRAAGGACSSAAIDIK